MNNYEERILALVSLGNLGNLPDLLDENAIQSAYTDLLEERLAPVTWQGESHGAPLSEEDLLTNTNLQTVSLFKRLKSEFKEAGKFIELYTEQLKEVQDSTVKIEYGIQTMKKMCEIHYEPGVQALQTHYIELQKEIVQSNNKINEELTKKINAKKAEVEKISEKLNSLRKVIVTGLDELVKPEDIQKKMCPICFENEVNTVLVPCGHTYCKSCSEIDKTRYAKCPQCRSQINARVKLFFTV
uniref:RING-type domain-containing protein n=1 Tax=viral metagenome TaxID=1070528 RepID=A0A6C0ANF7_9ZZZZ